MQEPQLREGTMTALSPSPSCGCIVPGREMPGNNRLLLGFVAGLGPAAQQGFSPQGLRLCSEDPHLFFLAVRGTAGTPGSEGVSVWGAKRCSGPRPAGDQLTPWLIFGHACGVGSCGRCLLFAGIKCFMLNAGLS